MSTVEQWGEFCAQVGQSTIGTQTRHEDYKGFVLKAQAAAIENGFAMRVSITPPNPGTVREVTQTPPWNSRQFANADDALVALLDYGRAIIDGEEPGITVASLIA